MNEGDPAGQASGLRRPGRFPPWLRKRLPAVQDQTVSACLSELGVDTVCRGARCPNQVECFQEQRAAFMLLGPCCTRGCGFCAVAAGEPAAPDPDEPERLARAAKRLGLSHVVVTSVTRDDMDDGGAGHFAACVAALRRHCPGASVEVLVPDFGGDQSAWATIAACGAEVVNHNVETVPRLYGAVRPEADYDMSLALLDFMKEQRSDGLTKSGMMLGLGEDLREVIDVAADLAGVGVDMITIGQYLCPERGRCLPVARFVTPAEFDELAAELRGMGFASVACAPFVRSSYHAEESLVASRGSGEPAE